MGNCFSFLFKKNTPLLENSLYMESCYYCKKTYYSTPYPILSNNNNEKYHVLCTQCRIKFNHNDIRPIL